MVMVMVMVCACVRACVQMCVWCTGNTRLQPPELCGPSRHVRAQATWMDVVVHWVIKQIPKTKGARIKPQHASSVSRTAN